jgi:hypothetical protein
MSGEKVKICRRKSASDAHRRRMSIDCPTLGDAVVALSSKYILLPTVRFRTGEIHQ